MEARPTLCAHHVASRPLPFLLGLAFLKACEVGAEAWFFQVCKKTRGPTLAVLGAVPKRRSLCLVHDKLGPLVFNLVLDTW